MKTLFIDTHSAKITIALNNDGDLKVLNEVSDKSHSEITVPTLEKLLNESNISTKDLTDIIVVNGPGSFTGVRIGVTIAKTLAYTLNIPIKTITSLEMFGVSAEDDFDVVTVEDAKGVYSALKKGSEFTDFQYRSKQEFNEYIEKNGLTILDSKKIDIIKIQEYLKTKEPVNPHKVNPIYIKEIDALK